MPEPLETDYLVMGSGIAGLNFALLAAEHGRVVVVTKKKLGGHQHELGPGRGRRSPRARRQLRAPRRGHARRGRRPVRPQDRRDVRRATARARSSACSSSACGSPAIRRARSISAARARTPATASSTGRTSPGARSSARCIAAVAKHPNITVLDEPHRGRPTVDGEVRRRPGVLRRVRPRQPHRRGQDDLRARDRARDRRHRQGLHLHVEPRRRDRRRRRDGVSHRRGVRRSRVRPVPPDGALPPARRQLPDLRGAARRGRHPEERARRDVHGRRATR